MNWLQYYRDLRFFIKYARRGWIISRSADGALPTGGPIRKAKVYGRGKSYEIKYFENREFLFAEFLAVKQFLGELRSFSKDIAARAKGQLYVFDWGANVGFFSVFASRPLAHMNPHFVAFEPFSENRQLYEENCRKNSVPYTLRPEALSNREGEQSLSMISTTGATINPDEASAYRAATGLSVPQGEVAKVGRLDRIWPALRIPRVDLIKIDIEGSEEWALEGAADTIRRFKPVILCSYEHYKNSKDRIKEIVLGIHPYTVYDNPPNKILTFK